MVTPEIESVKYLTQLRSDLGTFNPDQVEMVKGYLSKTNLRTKLVDVVSTLRMDLITNTDRELTGKFKQLKASLIGHIEKRILRLQSGVKPDCTDPWLALELKVANASTLQRCEEASTHIEDILFTCTELVDKRLGQASRVEAQEISEFRARFLPGYLGIIQATDQTERLAAPILDGFQQLEESLRQVNYDKAQSAALQIRTSLKAYALAVSSLG